MRLSSLRRNRRQLKPMPLWIESHVETVRKPKFRALVRELRLRPAYVLGHLHSLWHATLELAEDGILEKWTDEEIAEASDYPGDAAQWVQLLQRHRWLDGKTVHGWLKYAGRYLESRYRTSNPERLREIWSRHGLSWDKVPGRKQPQGWEKVRLEVLDRDAWTCRYCGCQDRTRMEVDHVVPVAEGGTDDTGNLVASCKSCNRSKGAKPVLSLSKASPPTGPTGPTVQTGPTGGPARMGEVQNSPGRCKWDDRGARCSMPSEARALYCRPHIEKAQELSASRGKSRSNGLAPASAIPSGEVLKQ